MSHHLAWNAEACTPKAVALGAIGEVNTQCCGCHQTGVWKLSQRCSITVSKDAFHLGKGMRNTGTVASKDTGTGNYWVFGKVKLAWFRKLLIVLLFGSSTHLHDDFNHFYPLVTSLILLPLLLEPFFFTSLCYFLVLFVCGPLGLIGTVYRTWRGGGYFVEQGRLTHGCTTEEDIPPPTTIPCQWK